MGDAAVVVKIDRGTGELVPQKLEKALAAFNLPDDRRLLIGWTQDRFEDGAKSFFLAGLGLIKLKLMNTNTYSHLLEENFPGTNLRVAQNYMAYAEAMINHPAFEAFQKERGGYSKALTVLKACTEAELQEADDSGELLGYTMDQLAKMSVRTMQKALIRAREHEAQAVKKAVAKTAAENAELKGKVEELEAALAEPDKESALKLIAGAGKHLDNALKLLNKLPRELLAQDAFLRQAAYAVLSQVKGDAEYLEMEIGTLAGDPGEMVRGYMGRLQAEAAGAPAEGVKS